MAITAKEEEEKNDTNPKWNFFFQNVTGEVEVEKKNEERWTERC